VEDVPRGLIYGQHWLTDVLLHFALPRLIVTFLDHGPAEDVPWGLIYAHHWLID
jgi:hypothetical protein